MRWQHTLMGGKAKADCFLYLEQWQSSINVVVNGNRIFSILTTDLGNNSSVLLSFATLVVSFVENPIVQRLTDRDMIRTRTRYLRGYQALLHSSP